jgi:prepilin-type N-terminal cleavage/methylation domain-containing protein
MKNRVKYNGFTLIETLIVLVILAISLLALAGLMVTTTKNNSLGGHMTEAATLAQDKLEEFRATPFDNILTGNDQKTGSHGIQYARNWNVATSTDGNLKTITLNIGWSDKYNHSIRIISGLNRKGPDRVEPDSVQMHD